MSVLTETQLRRFAGYVSGTLGASHRTRARRTGVKSVFLSHSSKDSDLALLVKTALESVDVEVYVDWLDAGLPEAVSAATAKILRERIQQNDLLLLLSTNNAMKSRWVPWELGFGDGRNGERRVAILEVQRDNETYQGNEYVELYQKVTFPGAAAGITTFGASGGYKPAPTDIKSWLRS